VSYFFGALPSQFSMSLTKEENSPWFSTIFMVSRVCTTRTEAGGRLFCVQHCRWLQWLCWNLQHKLLHTIHQPRIWKHQTVLSHNWDTLLYTQTSLYLSNSYGAWRRYSSLTTKGWYQSRWQGIKSAIYLEEHVFYLHQKTIHQPTLFILSIYRYTPL